MNWKNSMGTALRLALLAALGLMALAPDSRAQAPVFEIIPLNSWVKFHVKSSVAIFTTFFLAFEP